MVSGYESFAYLRAFARASLVDLDKAFIFKILALALCKIRKAGDLRDVFTQGSNTF